LARQLAEHARVSAAAPIGVGVIGLGVMGRTHVMAFRAADSAGLSNRLVAVCDRNAGRRAGLVDAPGNLGRITAGKRLFDPRKVKAYERAEDLIADPEVDVVSVCTHTDSHVDLALAALAAGKHVLVEKPVALRSSEAARLATAAAASRKLCMPAMCMRFWPGWDWMRAHVASGAFGAVKSAVFRRLGAHPAWSQHFYGDFDRSGGALFDLHVHDADFVRWCFGEPASVAASGSLEHATTSYRFEHGPAHVVAEGGWIRTPGFAFRMCATIVFEEATADFDLARKPKLLLTRHGSTSPVAIESTTGYDGEVRHFLSTIAGTTKELTATIAESVALTRMLEAEQKSLARATRESP
jgi:predicted dehydrogenase